MSRLTKNEERALKLFKERLLKAFPGEVKSIQLFGSKARGEATKHSDVDVLVVMKDTSRENSFLVSRIATEVMVDTDVVFYDPSKKFRDLAINGALTNGPGQINDPRSKNTTEL